jgi:predicted HD phosphohydrolase
MSYNEITKTKAMESTSKEEEKSLALALGARRHETTIAPTYFPNIVFLVNHAIQSQ